MKHLLLSALIVAVVILAPAIEASQFRITGVDVAKSEEMRLVLEVAALRLTKLLEVKFTDTVDIVIIETEQQFDSVAGGKLPEWGAGAAIPSRNLIVLRSPMMDKYPGSTADLLQHELAHIAIHHRVNGKNIPRFIDEGFASWFAGEWAFSQVTTVAAAQITGSLLPLRDIDVVNSFHQAQAGLAYAQSYLVVFYLIDKYGEVAFLELLDSFAKGQELNESFRHALGEPFWTFENGYRTFLKENFTLLAILSDTMGLWIVLAIIVVVGFILIKRRKKDAFDRWKEEEKLQSTDYDYEEPSPWD